ncbi:MAG TPA: sigma 54-interacting transcriptional regulator, partial [Candidatus Binatia bacterium]|nr:sigma 54-interacting transcriptional regulator [Candidatus Binatia bacterium]
KPFVKVSCAALPDTLIESELFGYEKGAFTGAAARKKGRFEMAEGGTLFLDEIGDINLSTQVKLLRVLQERELERVGGSKTIAVDVRVIAATNRDLERAIEEGRFREDLFYRLSVFPVRLPPLRERVGDIALLVRFFLERHASRIGRTITRVAPETLELLERYSWPGNVRELENVIERAIILARSDVLEVDPALLAGARSSDVTPGRGAQTAARFASDSAAQPASAQAMSERPASERIASEQAMSERSASERLASERPMFERAMSERAVSERPAVPDPASMPRALRDAERSHILSMLHATDWRIEGSTGAAALLGLRPSTLRSRMKKLGIERRSSGS